MHSQFYNTRTECSFQPIEPNFIEIVFYANENKNISNEEKIFPKRKKKSF